MKWITTVVRKVSAEKALESKKNRPAALFGKWFLGGQNKACARAAAAAVLRGTLLHKIPGHIILGFLAKYF